MATDKTKKIKEVKKPKKIKKLKVQKKDDPTVSTRSTGRGRPKPQ